MLTIYLIQYIWLLHIYLTQYTYTNKLLWYSSIYYYDCYGGSQLSGWDTSVGTYYGTADIALKAIFFTIYLMY